MFMLRNLSVLNYANGFTSWHYKTTDTIVEVCKPDYFANAADMLSPNDMIVINAAHNENKITFINTDKSGVSQ